MPKARGIVKTARPTQKILKPLHLSADETNDLLVFLESVSTFTSPWRGNSGTDDPQCELKKK